MIMRIISWVAVFYGEIGPGLLLAAGLPFFTFALVMVVREGLRRVRSEGAEAAAG